MGAEVKQTACLCFIRLSFLDQQKLHAVFEPLIRVPVSMKHGVLGLIFMGLNRN